MTDGVAEDAGLDGEVDLEVVAGDDFRRRSVHRERLALGLGRNQHLRVGMRRRLEDARARPRLDNRAVPHHADPVRGMPHDREVVGDQQHRHAEALLQLAQQLQDLRLDRHVEGGGGLVGDQQIWLAGERHGDHHPLALATRELVGERLEAPRGLAERHQLQQLLRADERLPLGQAPVQRQHLGDLAADGVERIEGGHRLLEDHRDPVAADLAQPACRGADYVDAVHLDAAARVRGDRIGQELEDRERRYRLARAALAHQRHGLAPLDVEGDAGDGTHGLDGAREIDREVADADQRAHALAITGRPACAGRRHRARLPR